MFKRIVPIVYLIFAVGLLLFSFYQDALTAQLRIPENPRPSYERISSEFFGNGSDGDLIVNAGTTVYLDETNAISGVYGTASAGQNQLSVLNATAFSVGDAILIHQTRGTGAGIWELAEVVAINGNDLILLENLEYSYVDQGNDQAQVLEIPQYSTCSIQEDGILTTHGWNGDIGGLVALMCAQGLTLGGFIRSNGTFGGYGTPGLGGIGMGFRGGVGRNGLTANAYAYSGEGILGPPVLQRMSNGNGGGGGYTGSVPNGQASGGGGGHALTGQDGQWIYGQGQSGLGGEPVGSSDLRNMNLGGGGGGGASDNTGSVGGGGGGGGIIFIASEYVLIETSGSINANGGDGGNGDYGSGGGGAGGSILLQVYTGTLGTNLVTAIGGPPGQPTTGGYGSEGRIRIEYCDSVTGVTNPPASVQQIPCPVPTSTPTTTSTNTPAITLTPDLTPTPSPSSTPGGIFLPLITYNFSTFFEGPNEQEPNDTSADANGPLRSNRAYFGVPVDERDFFGFVTQSQGQILVDLTNHPLAGVNGAQVQLFYESVAAGAVALDVTPPYQISYSGTDGRYYVLVFTDISKCGDCDSLYTLMVTYP